MRKAKYVVKPTTQFRKDYKLAMRRGLKISLLEDVVTILAMGETLPAYGRKAAGVLFGKIVPKIHLQPRERDIPRLNNPARV